VAGAEAVAAAEGSNGKPRLRRAVGTWGSFAWGYADVGADVYVAVGLVAAYAQGMLPVAFLAAGLIYVIVGLAYTELSSAYPVAGGSQYYTLRGLGDFWGFTAGWALLLDFTIDVSLFAISTAGYLDYFLKPYLPWITRPLPLGAQAIFLILILVYLNIVGIRESSFLNELFSAIDILRETFLLVAGFALAFNPQLFVRQVTQVPSTHSFLYGISIAIVSYVGLESISQVAQETVKPATVIPRTSVSLILMVLIYALGFAVLGIGTLGWQQLAANQSDSIAAIAERIPYVGSVMAPLTAVLAATLIYASTNTGIVGSSRIAWSMSQFHLLPPWFNRVHPKFRTPVRTILIFSGLALLQVVLASVLTGNAMDTLANMYAFGALTGYILVLISLVRLRLTDTHTPRPWRVPLNVSIRYRGHHVQLPAVILVGILGNLGILLMVVATHPLGRITGPAWLLLGFALYFLYRAHAGLFRSMRRDWEGEQVAALTEAEEWDMLRTYRAALARRDAEQRNYVEDLE
jgi:APA family basic amino acid/polyamine antiporter